MILFLVISFQFASGFMSRLSINYFLMERKTALEKIDVHKTAILELLSLSDDTKQLIQSIASTATLSYLWMLN